jgi:hypothetical protein
MLFIKPQNGEETNIIHEFDIKYDMNLGKTHSTKYNVLGTCNQEVS